MAVISREWIALLVLSPLFVLPPVGNPLLTLVLLLPLVWITSRPLLPLTELNGSLLLLALAVLVSLTASFDILFSAPKVLGVVFGIAVFFAIVRSIRDQTSLDFFVRALSVAGGALAILGLLGTDWIHKVVVLRSITARLPAVIRGVPGQAEGFQPNAIAGALVMFLPLQFALTVSDASRRQRLFHGALLAVTAITLLLTQSRGGYLSLAAGCFAWALWHGRRSRLAAVTTLFLALAIAVPLRHRLAPVIFGSVGAGRAQSR
jgi:hypothetical protein